MYWIMMLFMFTASAFLWTFLNISSKLIQERFGLSEVDAGFYTSMGFIS